MSSKRSSASGSSEPFGAPDPLRDFLEAVIVDPLGLFASVPQRLAKGKAKIESQTKTANMIGKFVVPIAKRKIDAELKAAAESVRSYLTNTEPKRSSKPPTENSSVESSAQSSVEPSIKPAEKSAKKSGKTRPAPRAKTKAEPRVEPKVQSKAGPKASAGTQREGKGRPVRVASASVTPSAQAIPSASDTGLDGYDDLPASSIVGLLEALTVTQLRAIAAYESSQRNRQTILGGVARLVDAAK